MWLSSLIKQDRISKFLIRHRDLNDMKKRTYWSKKIIRSRGHKNHNWLILQTPVLEGKKSFDRRFIHHKILDWEGDFKKPLFFDR